MPELHYTNKCFYFQNRLFTLDPSAFPIWMVVGFGFWVLGLGAWGLGLRSLTPVIGSTYGWTHKMLTFLRVGSGSSSGVAASTTCNPSDTNAALLEYPLAWMGHMAKV